MLRIDIAALADGLHVQTLRVASEALGLDPAAFDEAVIDLRLDVAGRRVLAAFDVSSVATLECDRTLVEYRQPVRGSHAVLFVPPDQLPMGTDDDDVQPLLDDATALDLTDAVRDTLLLALPLRRVAPEAEDAEIPTSFGAPTDAEGNPVDDRWEALRRLRDDT
ncbi:MAG TPA: DUF177 domain-containing protein [Rubricoccaceae bacterium]|nr:DUF177 domain-containing protein [Rubricoccaceae bacterium]